MLSIMLPMSAGKRKFPQQSRIWQVCFAMITWMGRRSLPATGQGLILRVPRRPRIVFTTQICNGKIRLLCVSCIK
ncbi:hypothetical protein D3C75_575490 [compost metagenome]